MAVKNFFPVESTSIHISVDVAALTVENDTLKVLTIECASDPFRGQRALPGGLLHNNETTEDGALRKLKEDTHLKPPKKYLEQLKTYGPLERDPRGPVIAIVYLILLPPHEAQLSPSLPSRAQWQPVSQFADRTTLAFDHNFVLEDAIERARSKIEYTPIATSFCPEEFTISQLRKIYEAVWNTKVEPRNFNRKIQAAHILESTGKKEQSIGRPAELFRLKKHIAPNDFALYPALLRPTRNSTHLLKTVQNT